MRIRITPAYAGKSELWERGKRRCGITPAYAGKSDIKSENSKYSSGSPPPMRGKDLAEKKVLSDGGITPAYAGKSDIKCRMFFDHQDHPRLCGEKLKRQIESKQLKGSPPPMRGKAGHHLQASGRAGITPAYAGKSSPPDDVMSVL